MGVDLLSGFLHMLPFLFSTISVLPLIKTLEASCGYDSCHPTKDSFVNVHIVAHTHNDVGWTSTVDEYYHTLVEKILTSTTEALLANRNRRFIYVESAFLFKWWNAQTENVKEQVKQLINNGQLELVSGAWSMNDEATTNYQSIIDQFTLGLKCLHEIKINNTFGPCGRPRVGWQIDPFGHSSEMASIFAQLGFDGLFLGRIDYQDKGTRFANQTAEMIWRGSESLGEASEIFTSVLYNLYLAPKNFCFDIYCRNVLRDDQLRVKWNMLVKLMNEQAAVYKTNNIMLTMGGDFHYSVAHYWFDSLDTLIKYGNDQQKTGSKYHLLYSTPSCYLKAVHDEAARKAIKWPINTYDFFPYATEENGYWTGYYTSRSTLKRFERMGNNFLQICKQLSVMANLSRTHLEKIDTLKEAMGVLQHHDAISGTEQQHVAEDYAKSLSKGLEDCGDVSSASLNKLTLKDLSDLHQTFNSCLLSNISQCQYSENFDSFVVTVYNPLSRFVNHYVRIPVTKGQYVLKGPNGESLPVQMVPVPKQILNVSERRSNATLELVFLAVQVPPLGFKTYQITKTRETPNRPANKLNIEKKLSVGIDNKTGFLNKIFLNGKAFPIRQEFLYYHGHKHENQPSGAYVFHPEEIQPTPASHNATYAIYKGDVVTEIHQTFNEWVSQVIRIYPGEQFVEFQWLIGPLPDNGKPSVEVISRFTTELKSESTFYTDSNGREMLKRVRNLRPKWKLVSADPVASNYYPVTSKILIRDGKGIEFALLTDRAQGGTSLRDGELELMVHRKCLLDDNLGVKEALNEKNIVRGSHYLVVDFYNNKPEGGYQLYFCLIDSITSVEKDIAQRKMLEAWTFFSPIQNRSYDLYKALYKLEYSGLNFNLPDNVQILTLEPWNDNNVLLRLEHVFQKDEHPRLSKTAEIDVKKLFKALAVVDLRETTLGANQWLNESKPMKFKCSELSVKNGNTNESSKFVIKLYPMQIRTFIVTIQRV